MAAAAAPPTCLLRVDQQPAALTIEACSLTICVRWVPCSGLVCGGLALRGHKRLGFASNCNFPVAGAFACCLWLPRSKVAVAFAGVLRRASQVGGWGAYGDSLPEGRHSRVLRYGACARAHARMQLCLHHSRAHGPHWCHSLHNAQKI